MHVALWLGMIVVGGAPPDSALEVRARLDGESLDVGGEHSILVDVRFGPGTAASDAGPPAPIIQLDVPRCVELTGRVLQTKQELAKNGFVQEPFERLLEEVPARIGFRLVTAPANDERIGMNVLAYVTRDGGEYFIRRRLSLALAPGVAASEASSAQSDWGVDETLLQLGDKAVPFELPRADGSTLALEDLLGKANLLITTYRAHW